MIEVKKMYLRSIKKRLPFPAAIFKSPEGQIIGLFGSNGAGKTTLMKCIMGFLTFEGGNNAGRKKDRSEQHIQIVFCHRRPLLLSVYHCRRS